MKDFSAATLIWQTDPPSKDLIAIVRKNLSEFPADPDDELQPGEVMYHLIPLEGRNYEGPSVILQGNEQFNGFDAWYHPEGDEGITFDMKDIPGFEEKLRAAGWKPEDEEDGS